MDMDNTVQDELNDLTSLDNLNNSLSTGNNMNINNASQSNNNIINNPISERILRYNRIESGISMLDVVYYLEHSVYHRRSARLHKTYLVLSQKMSNWPITEHQSTLSSYTNTNTNTNINSTFPPNLQQQQQPQQLQKIP